MVLTDISRKQAFLTHLSLSMVIFFVVLYLIAFEWFPSFYYRLDNGYLGTAIIFFVDVVIGPGLTLLVFTKGKSKFKLKFDLTVIIIIQLAALSWGVRSVYQDRPAVTVFHDGWFLCMTQTVTEDLDIDKINQGKSGKQKLAYLDSPKTFDGRNEFWKEALQHGLSSEYYYVSRFEPIDESNVDKILEYTLSLDDIKNSDPDGADVLGKYIETHPGYQETYYFYPLKGRFNSGIAVFDSGTMRIIEVLDVSTSLLAERPITDIPGALGLDGDGA